MIGNVDVIRTISEMVEKRNIPHLLFHGNAGTGKTSLAHIVIKELYNSHKNISYLELNASDDNGVDTIRNHVKEYAMHSHISAGGDVEFRVVILDECDQMTNNAQGALRRIMEKFYANCRFILICNNVQKVIEPLRSRCTMCEFKPLLHDELKKRASFILEKEHKNVDEAVLDYIVTESYGDMRYLINTYLERIYAMNLEKITLQDIITVDMSGDNAISCLRLAFQGKFVQSVENFYTLITKDRMVDILNVLFNFNLKNEKASDEMKAEIALILVKTEELFKTNCSYASCIQYLVSSAMSIGSKYKKNKTSTN